MRDRKGKNPSARKRQQSQEIERHRNLLNYFAFGGF
jgi:hypothetical protein